MPVNNYRTWQWDRGLAGWEYRPMARSDGRLVPLDLEVPEVRKRWLGGLLGRLPELLGDFAYATKVDVTEYGVGDDACTAIWTTKGKPPAQLVEFVEHHERLHHVHVDLTLTCQGMDLQPLEIEAGGSFYVVCTLTESGELKVTAEAPVYIRVALNADIYAPLSLGEVRNNALLAALNGPRLASFLERMEREVPAELIDIYGDNYPGMVGPRGFLAPAPPAPDA